MQEGGDYIYKLWCVLKRHTSTNAHAFTPLPTGRQALSLRAKMQHTEEMLCPVNFD